MADHSDSDDPTHREGDKTQQQPDAAPYAVGYCKPPVKTQFKRGQSGNPKGRPRGSRNFATDFKAELDSKIAVTENGKRRRVTKRQAIAKQAVNQAVQGNQKAIVAVVNAEQQFVRQAASDSGQGAADVLDTPVHAAVMESLLQEILEAHAAPVRSAPSPDRQTPAAAAPRPADPPEPSESDPDSEGQG